MDLFTRRQLDELLAVHVEPCISIYLPTHRTAPETAQDPIRFKNTLRAVNRELEQAGLISREIREQTKAVESWLHDADFWRHQSDGLAVFLTSEVLKRFRLPRSFPELYRIDNHFYVNPLLPLLQTNGTFYILAVSQNACRLFTGNRDTIEELQEANLPKDLRSALGWWRESQLNFHSMQRKPASRGGDDTAIYHGHQEETKDSDLTAYFRKIDAGVTDALRGEHAPLIFAGVEYLYPIYSSVNNYPSLCEQAITGNPDDLQADDLHQAAWKIVHPLLQAQLHDVISDFMQRRSQGTATDDFSTVLTAARDGLVEALIIPQGIIQPGHFDGESGQIDLATTTDENAEDLIDKAVLLTLRSSGEVLAIEQELMPVEATALALLRAPQNAIT
ncbi:MAG: hypothetical protein KDA52_18100, partial [Planctomycetaceae bacterium]|nr:hypothetical protein [Planctomycetaceae bacterium]